MATLYLENVPDDLYDALRKRARNQRRSIAALELLRQDVPTETALKQRRAFMRKLDELRAPCERRDGNFPSTEEMIREDCMQILIEDASVAINCFPPFDSGPLAAEARAP